MGGADGYRTTCEGDGVTSDPYLSNKQVRCRWSVMMSSDVICNFYAFASQTHKANV
jgi:hypothetical protein